MARSRTEEKRQTILDAAARIFSSREFHEVHTDEIAACAGVGKGTIYRYFPTKQDLYFATILRGLGGLQEVLSAACSGPGCARTARLERIAREILTFFWRRRDLYTLLYRNERRFLALKGKIRQEREAIVRVVEQTIAEGSRQGEFRSVDAATAAELFLGMIRAANLFRRDTDTVEHLVGEVMSVFTYGVARERHA